MGLRLWILLTGLSVWATPWGALAQTQEARELLFSARQLSTQALADYDEGVARLDDALKSNDVLPDTLRALFGVEKLGVGTYCDSLAKHYQDDRFQQGGSSLRFAATKLEGAWNKLNEAIAADSSYRDAWALLLRVDLAMQWDDRTIDAFERMNSLDFAASKSFSYRAAFSDTATDDFLDDLLKLATLYYRDPLLVRAVKERRSGIRKKGKSKHADDEASDTTAVVARAEETVLEWLVDQRSRWLEARVQAVEDSAQGASGRRGRDLETRRIALLNELIWTKFLPARFYELLERQSLAQNAYSQADELTNQERAFQPEVYDRNVGVRLSNLRTNINVLPVDRSIRVMMSRALRELDTSRMSVHVFPDPRSIDRAVTVEEHLEIVLTPEENTVGPRRVLYRENVFDTGEQAVPEGTYTFLLNFPRVEVPGRNLFPLQFYQHTGETRRTFDSGLTSIHLHSSGTDGGSVDLDLKAGEHVRAGPILSLPDQSQILFPGGTARIDVTIHRVPLAGAFDYRFEVTSSTRPDVDETGNQVRMLARVMLSSIVVMFWAI